MMRQEDAYQFGPEGPVLHAAHKRIAAARRQDPGDPDFEFPDVKDLDPHEAAALWDRVEREAKEANKRAAILKDRKVQAKELALQAIEASPYTSVRIEGAEGREVQLTPYPWTVFRIVNEDAFREWAKKEAERYYDESPKLRESVFLEEMRRRDEDKEPLPPGVSSWTDTKISRTTVAQKRRKGSKR
jgi:hypothetical protein